MNWGQQYAAAWSAHDVEALVAMYAADGRCTDMPHGMSWEGHDGIREMFQATLEFRPDVEVMRHRGFRDGHDYVWEWTMSGTIAGQWISYRGISVGTLDDVVEQRGRRRSALRRVLRPRDRSGERPRSDPDRQGTSPPERRTLTSRPPQQAGSEERRTLLPGPAAPASPGSSYIERLTRAKGPFPTEGKLANDI